MPFAIKAYSTGFAILTIIVLTMGLSDFFKKSTAKENTVTGPYKDSSTNVIYHMLFCDNVDLYKANTQLPYAYPFDVLFSATSTAEDLQQITADENADPRVRMLAYNKLLAGGHKPANKELLAVIVEVSLNEGLDVLASFSNGTARYINHTGRILIWETTDDSTANQITRDLFDKSRNIVSKIGPWDKPRKQYPPVNNTRLSFLVSDGLYFGEASTNLLFNDQMAGPALASATQLMQYLTQRSLEQNKNR